MCQPHAACMDHRKRIQELINSLSTKVVINAELIVEFTPAVMFTLDPKQRTSGCFLPSMQHLPTEGRRMQCSLRFKIPAFQKSFDIRQAWSQNALGCTCSILDWFILENAPCRYCITKTSTQQAIVCRSGWHVKTVA